MAQAATKPQMACVTPHLICAGVAEAIDFYKRAFNATDDTRINGPDGTIIHASVKIGDSIVMLAEENQEWGALGPKTLKGSPVTLHLIVPDADTTMAQAVAAGAQVTMPLEDAFWGDRYGKLVDPFGHHWSLATPQRQLSPDEIKDAMAKAFATPQS